MYDDDDGDDVAAAAASLLQDSDAGMEKNCRIITWPAQDIYG